MSSVFSSSLGEGARIVVVVGIVAADSVTGGGCCVASGEGDG